MKELIAKIWVLVIGPALPAPEWMRENYGFPA